MMGAAARGVAAEKGYILGIAPRFFDQPGVLYEKCTEFIFTENMRERKKLLEEKSDATIVAPGGIGTYEEFFEIFTLKSLKRIDRPIVLYNIDGYYDKMKALLEYTAEEKFMDFSVLDLVVFLDEPTAGMDTTTRQRFWEIINDLKKSGVTILYSSHYIEEVEHTADRILVLHQGKLIRDTTPHAMRSEEKEKQVTLASRFAPSLDKLAAIYEVTEKRDVVTFMTKDIESIWSSLQAKGCRISDIEIQNKTLLDSLSDSTREDKS